MELLPEGQKNAVQVTYDDQLKINKFSKLIMRKDTLEAKLENQMQEQEYLDDVQLEIELVDDDELINYKIGESFVLLKQKKIIKLLDVDSENINNTIESLNDQISNIDSELKTLKNDLYIKFGNNINLER